MREGIEGPQDDLPTDDLAAALRLAVGRLGRRLRQEAVGGLTASQLSALASVERHGPLTAGELAAIEAVAKPTLSRLLVHLEDRELVHRGTDPDDRRVALLEITPDGRRALVEVRTARSAYLRRRLAELTDDERATLAAAAPLLVRLFEDEAAEAPEDDR